MWKAFFARSSCPAADRLRGDLHPALREVPLAARIEAWPRSPAGRWTRRLAGSGPRRDRTGGHRPSTPCSAPSASWSVRSPKPPGGDRFLPLAVGSLPGRWPGSRRQHERPNMPPASVVDMAANVYPVWPAAPAACRHALRRPPASGGRGAARPSIRLEVGHAGGTV